MNEQLRVPTVAFAAEVVCSDGRRFKGKVFVPASAPTHEGPTRAEEWINATSSFFPFLVDGEPRPFLLNKRAVVTLTVEAAADAGGQVEESLIPRRRVRVEAGPEQFEGTIVIEMPEEHARSLDLLNGPETFLTLRDGDRHHLVQKKRITRVVELGEE